MPGERLWPHHLTDLKGSGLTDETIQRSGCYSATEATVRELLGFGVGPGLVFPFPGCVAANGQTFSQVKPDTRPDWMKTAKYLSPKGSGCRLYVPALLHPSVLTQASKTLYLTEGAKKALKAAQEGLCCVALAGVDSWKQAGPAGPSVPIADLDKITWTRRTVHIVYDSDAGDKDPVREAEWRLFRELQARGASVSVVRLPAGVQGAKVGLDDYLCSHSVDAFCQLEPQAIPHPAKAKQEQKAKLTIHELGDFLETKPPEGRFLVEGGILPVRGILIAGGPAKIGKSVLAINLGLRLATGTCFLRWKVPERCRVLYVQSEISPVALWDRFTKMVGGLPDGLNGLRGWFKLVTKRGLKLDRKEGIDGLMAAIEAATPRVLILDPLRRFLSGDENKSGDVGRFFDVVDRLIDRYKMAVVIVHHFGKPGAEEREGAMRLRGSSVIFDAGDSYLNVTRRDHKRSKRYVRLSGELREADDPPLLTLYRNPDTLWFEQIEDDVVDPLAVQAMVRKLGEPTGATLKRQLNEAYSTQSSGVGQAMTEAVSLGLVSRKPAPREPGQRGQSWIYFVPKLGAETEPQ